MEQRKRVGEGEGEGAGGDSGELDQEYTIYSHIPHRRDTSQLNGKYNIICSGQDIFASVFFLAVLSASFFLLFSVV